MSRLLYLLLVVKLCLLSSSLFAQEKAVDKLTAKEVLVVYRGNSTDSKALAQFYAKARKIPTEQLIALDLTSNLQTGRITRADFQKTIERPLQKLTAKKQFAHIRCLALIYGLPWAITYPHQSEDPAQDGVDTAASVDSELTLLRQPEHKLSGGLPNPLLQEKGDEPRKMLLVTRLDAPRPEQVKKIITDSINAEQNGLAGMAYIDLWNNSNSGYQLGDNWMKKASAHCWQAGIPAVVDPHSTRYPCYYPMQDAAFYLGWYTWNADGAFLSDNFSFVPGAIACHLHSFSATSLHDENKSWAGPLLSKGAAAVLGNVWEPYLHATTNLARFTELLIAGNSFAHSAWAATPMLSWMNVAIGDPLYRPFKNHPNPQSENPYAQIRHFKQADWDKAMADKKLTNPQILEALALKTLQKKSKKEEDFMSAMALLKRADLHNKDPESRIRYFHHRISALRNWSKNGQTSDKQQIRKQVLHELQLAFATLPPSNGKESVLALLHQLDPPAPLLLPHLPPTPPVSTTGGK